MAVALAQRSCFALADPGLRQPLHQSAPPPSVPWLAADRAVRGSRVNRRSGRRRGDRRHRSRISPPLAATAGGCHPELSVRLLRGGVRRISWDVGPGPCADTWRAVSPPFGRSSAMLDIDPGLDTKLRTLYEHIEAQRPSDALRSFAPPPSRARRRDTQSHGGSRRGRGARRGHRRVRDRAGPSWGRTSGSGRLAVSLLPRPSGVRSADGASPGNQPCRHPGHAWRRLSLPAGLHAHGVDLHHVVVHRQRPVRDPVDESSRRHLHVGV